MLQVAVHLTEDRCDEVFAQLLALAIDVAVAAAGEIDALEGASAEGAGFEELLGAPGTVAADEERFATAQLADVGGLHIHDGLNDGALGGDDHDLVVGVIEGGADAPRVADGEGLAAAGGTTDDKAAVPGPGSGLHDARKVDVPLHLSRHLQPRAPLVDFELSAQAVGLRVEQMAHLLEDKIRVGILAGVLPGGADLGEDVVRVREVEIAAEGQVAGAPIAAAQEGVDVSEARPAGGAVTQMAHVEFAGEGQTGRGVSRIGEALGSDVAILAVDRLEDLRDGARPSGPLTKHILLAGRGAELDAGEPRAVLPAVVLLLHEEVELVEGIHPGAVFTMIILERLEQPDHCHAAFMLQSLHFVCREFILRRQR